MGFRAHSVLWRPRSRKGGIRGRTHKNRQTFRNGDCIYRISPPIQPSFLPSFSTFWPMTSGRRRRQVSTLHYGHLADCVVSKYRCPASNHMLQPCSIYSVNLWSRKFLNRAAVFVASTCAFPLSLLRLSGAKFKYFTQKLTPLIILLLEPYAAANAGCMCTYRRMPREARPEYLWGAIESQPNLLH